ncbi:phosphoenolpyruvate--protein phosphotransferase [Palleronia caenipelagi]|uniref:phosphoenolpyruvate--protein phosphotransferase n=1 Tax=Palleronia caenipelagi TaxID=2489174 RepID=A0A547Q9L9_9RHOB|nr:phosphoenolpyruvate--protein phosphotransferase [Palleronia caenipelagi]TRD23041.1 phosphoenolpyruvate--protein phosphotransferase [Palleronia caenipelagi]
MPYRGESESRKLLKRLHETFAEKSDGQARLDMVTGLIAESMETEVCSIYLFRDDDTLELCATHGLNAEAVHQTRLKLGEGLVGRVALTGDIINAADAPSQKGFRYMAETGEEVFSSFLGVPLQRQGDKLGVLVVQSREARSYSEDEVYGIQVVAMLISEMTELGAFLGEGAAMAQRHTQQVLIRGTSVQEGLADGHVLLHEPRVVVTNLVNDDPEKERARLEAAVDQLRINVDSMLAKTQVGKEDREVLETYRMFARSRSWVKRMCESIELGLSAEAAVDKEHSTARARLESTPDPYIRERMQDLDDLARRLLRILTGQGSDTGAEIPVNPVLVARNIGPGELMEYGRRLKGIVLEQGSVGSHAAIVARALAIPLVIRAKGIVTEALNGDHIMVDGEQGSVHLRPGDAVRTAFHDSLAMKAKAQERFVGLRDLPAETTCGQIIELHMNAGLIADLPSIDSSGAEGVGLFRTELQFLASRSVPKRGDLARVYSRIMDAAHGKPVLFRTLDIGSDKVLPYMKRPEEPNPALGWRAIRVGLDKRGVMRMQLQALIRAAAGRPLWVMFPFVAQIEEFDQARDILNAELANEHRLGHSLPERVQVGAMIETPSIAFAPDRFFKEADFLSIGGNDLKQFFFAADRENERVRRRYDTLSTAFLEFVCQISKRAQDAGTPLSFCGEDAGRPLEALAIAACGVRKLSMRPTSIGPVKHLLRQANLDDVRAQLDAARAAGESNMRTALTQYIGPLDR